MHIHLWVHISVDQAILFLHKNILQFSALENLSTQSTLFARQNYLRCFLRLPPSSLLSTSYLFSEYEEYSKKEYFQDK